MKHQRITTRRDLVQGSRQATLSDGELAVICGAWAHLAILKGDATLAGAHARDAARWASYVLDQGVKCYRVTLRHHDGLLTNELVNATSVDAARAQVAQLTGAKVIKVECID